MVRQPIGHAPEHQAFHHSGTPPTDDEQARLGLLAIRRQRRSRIAYLLGRINLSSSVSMAAKVLSSTER